MEYGVFISHSHNDWALAGRIYDYLDARGYSPFLDVASLRHGRFTDALDEQIRSSPYFLCVVTPNILPSLTADGWIYKEIRLALESGREIILLGDNNFAWPDYLPSDADGIRDYHILPLTRENFLQTMGDVCRRDIDRQKIRHVFGWRTQANASANTYITSRETMEKSLATLENRFGQELIDCVRQKREYTGENRIRFIHMSCYAASVIFSPTVNMVDERAYDRGMIFNVVASLLKDDEFSFEIIINTPDCFAVRDAIANDKLGNSALEECPEAIFYSAYANICRLTEEDPIFKKAKQEKRFRFMVTDAVMPCAIFQVEYKHGYEEHNHIKVDLYSEGLVSNMDRRCMLFFESSDPENYLFFEKRYEYMRNVRRSRELIRANHDAWIARWNELQEEFDL